MLIYKRMHFYSLSVDETAKSLKTNQKDGLSNNEVNERLKTYGKNELKIKETPLLVRILRPLGGIFNYILYVAGFISFWHQEYVDGIIIIVIVLISAIIEWVQSRSAEKILKSLKKQNSQQVVVKRDFKKITIDATDLVPGDVIYLTEGEKVPADSRIITQTDLRADESILTGESFPVKKQIKKLDLNTKVFMRSNMLYQGTFVVSGETTAIVTATGNNTEFGKIAALSSNDEISPTQVKINDLIKKLIYAVFLIGIIAFFFSLFRGIDAYESLRFVLALIVSVVPEGLPVAITIVLAFSIKKLARHKALVTNMRALDSIGIVNVIATDKTGTLTHNKLKVHDVFPFKGHAKTTLKNIIRLSLNIKQGFNDPMDIALEDYIGTSNDNGYSLVKTFPFKQDLSLSGNLFKTKDSYLLVIKGAYRSLVEYLNSEADLKDTNLKAHEYGVARHKVIAFMTAKIDHEITSLNNLKRIKNFELIGIAGISDSIRKEAKAAVNDALSAKTKVVMITGDQFDTAYAIGQQLNIAKSPSDVFDCSKMHDYSDQELEEIVENTTVFARVLPENKYKLLKLLKQKNITAMTGDGVNDVPAISNAHIGIAMGSGTQIAKDASDIILLDDNFQTIINALKEGRIIFSNIQKMFVYVLSTNIGETITLVGALIIGLPLPLLPIQILYTNLVTDTTLVIPLGLEPGDKSIMKNPPRKPNDPILKSYLIARIVIIAFAIGITTLSVYSVALIHLGQEKAMTLAFTSLVVMQWAKAFCSRELLESSFKQIFVKNIAFLIGLISSILMQVLALYSPLSAYLKISYVDFHLILLVIILDLIVIFTITEIHKYIGRKRNLTL